MFSINVIRQLALAIPVILLSFIYWVAKPKGDKKRPFTWRTKDNKRPPLLLIPSEENFKWNMYNVLDNTFIDQVRLPNKRFCGSSKGWLMSVERDMSVRLIDTFSRVKGSEKKKYLIVLPPLEVLNGQSHMTESPRRHYYVYKAMITSDPVLDRKNCTVVVIYGGWTKLAFLRLGTDKRWTYVEYDLDNYIWSGFQEVVQVDRCKFYAVQSSGNKLFSFDTNTRSTNYLTPKLVEHNSISPSYFQFKRYLLYSIEKELLMVLRYHANVRPDSEKHKTMKFRIFKLSTDKCSWIEKESLGDVALFLGDNSSLSVLASNIPGCMPNCIYFNHDYDGLRKGSEPVTDFGVYNVQSQTISKPHCKEANDLMEKTTLPSIWV